MILQRLVRLNGAVIGVWDAQGRYQPRAGQDRPYNTERTRRKRRDERFWARQRHLTDLFRVATPPIPDKYIEAYLDRIANPAVIIRPDGGLEFA